MVYKVAIVCKAGFFMRILLESLPIILFIGMILLTLDDFNKGKFLWEKRNIAEIVFLIISPVIWWIIHFSIIPNTKVIVTEEGIHGSSFIKIGSWIIFNRHKTIPWQNVDKFAWFNNGFGKGYMVWGNNLQGKYGGLGPSVFSTNTMEAVKYIVEILPREKIDPVVFKMLDKYAKKHSSRKTN